MLQSGGGSGGGKEKEGAGEGPDQVQSQDQGPGQDRGGDQGKVESETAFFARQGPGPVFYYGAPFVVVPRDLEHLDPLSQWKINSQIVWENVENQFPWQECQPILRPFEVIGYLS